LESLTTIEEYMDVSSNDALCQSLVDTFVDAMMALGYSGTLFYIRDNADC